MQFSFNNLNVVPKSPSPASFACMIHCQKEALHNEQTLSQACLCFPALNIMSTLACCCNLKFSGSYVTSIVAEWDKFVQALALTCILSSLPCADPGDAGGAEPGAVGGGGPRGRQQPGRGAALDRPAHRRGGALAAQVSLPCRRRPQSAGTFPSYFILHPLSVL